MTYLICISLEYETSFQNQFYCLANKRMEKIIPCFLFLFGFLKCSVIEPSNIDYDVNSNTYFSYKPLDYENCRSASDCDFTKDITRKETIKDFSICTLEETSELPSCPYPEDNVCVCIKDTDCLEIYDILAGDDQSLKRSVKKNYQKCGFEESSPKYCCPYSNSTGNRVLSKVKVIEEIEEDETDNNFECVNGEFVESNESVVCDGIADCEDESDEENCDESTCKGYWCKESKECISIDFLCDSDSDCSDGSDEQFCFGYKCPDHKSKCRDRTICIDNNYICDGDEDCPDGSDEAGCFECQNGDLISNEQVCDGNSDCNEDSDEKNCDAFECKGFWCDASEECFPKDWQCDGEEDCYNGKDEQECNKSNCKGFLCENKQCVDKNEKCNVGCQDNKGCGNNSTCYGFQCKNRQCIALHLRCNGEKDCDDGSDEGCFPCDNKPRYVVLVQT